MVRFLPYNDLDAVNKIFAGQGSLLQVDYISSFWLRKSIQIIGPELKSFFSRL